MAARPTASAPKSSCALGRRPLGASAASPSRAPVCTSAPRRMTSSRTPTHAARARSLRRRNPPARCRPGGQRPAAGAACGGTQGGGCGWRPCGRRQRALRCLRHDGDHAVWPAALGWARPETFAHGYLRTWVEIWAGDARLRLRTMARARALRGSVFPGVTAGGTIVDVACGSGSPPGATASRRAMSSSLPSRRAGASWFPVPAKSQRW